jgi:hypothetical protein
MPIFRRKDGIYTASGIFALCNVCTVHRLRVHSQPVYGSNIAESEDTRCCVYTIFPPEDGHVNARKMSRIIA